jgi:type VI secretion system protein ImpL
MNAPAAAPGPERSGGFLRRHWYDAARGVLVLWALGLAVAAWQLGGWRQELTRTLVQLNADAQFRARVPRRDAVDPEWYRRKALSLLAATERMRRDTAWSLFVPGSWHFFDDLEERLQERVAGEFGDIVVETIRRELYARASRLTGAPQALASGDLQPDGECQSPVPQNLERKLAGAPEDLPEFVAVAGYVRNVEQLDAAVQDFLSLQYAGGQPEQLRKLVAYTLNADLPGSLAQGAVLFHGPDEVSLEPALMQTRLQWATRCALGKGMAVLYARLLDTNDLFALEQGLAQRSAGLFDAGARPLPLDRTLEGLRAVHALLDDQEALLSKGRNAWMRGGTLQLGAAYQDVLRRIGATRLLGPEVVQQLQGQSGAAFAEFRRRFEASFGSQDEPGIVWLAQEQRFGLSPQRAGLRDGLAALLATSFMAEEGPPPAAAARSAAALPLVTGEARALADARTRFLSQHLATFPPSAQPVVSRVVDARVSGLIYEKAYRALSAGLPKDVQTPLDPAGFRQQREQVLALNRLLKETGGAALGQRLVAAMDGELLRRLAVLDQDWRAQPLHDGRGSDFGWWQGEALVAAQAVGAADAASVQPAIARMATRLDLLDQQAKAMLALGSPALAAEPAAQHWVHLQAELERYQARSGDSSLLRLERYLTALGGDLRRDNCADRLAGLAPPANGDDDIAERHLQLHQALLSRCLQLRLQPAPVSALAAPVAPTAPVAPAAPVAATTMPVRAGVAVPVPLQ